MARLAVVPLRILLALTFAATQGSGKVAAVVKMAKGVVTGDDPAQFRLVGIGPVRAGGGRRRRSR